MVEIAAFNWSVKVGHEINKSTEDAGMLNLRDSPSVEGEAMRVYRANSDHFIGMTQMLELEQGFLVKKER